MMSPGPVGLIALLQPSLDIRQTSADVVVSGPVPLECTVTFSEPDAIIDMAVRTPQSVASVTYVCNAADGIVRRVFSENNGALQLDDYRIPYMLEERGSDELGFAARALASPFVSQIAGHDALVTGVTDQLLLMVPSLPAGIVAGQYTDSVTIEISPN
jgi:hypothetical protein